MDLRAEFEDGEPLGLGHVTVVRPSKELDDEEGHFENGEFWGLLELKQQPSRKAMERLGRGDRVRLQSDGENPVRRLPVPSLVVQPVRDVVGDLPRFLIYEITDE